MKTLKNLFRRKKPDYVARCSDCGRKVDIRKMAYYKGKWSCIEWCAD